MQTIPNCKEMSDLNVLNQIYNLAINSGPIVAILLLMSLIVLTLSLVKLAQFARLGMLLQRNQKPVFTFLQHWSKGEFKQAEQALGQQQYPAAQLLRHASQAICAKRLAGPALQNELQRYGLALVATLRQYLRPLELIATVAPLIGLLGTVTGMIEAFKAMELAGKQVDPSVLSGGIWQALLTTAIGLIVAIPATLIHSWLERKVESCAEAMADALAQLNTLEALEPEAPAESPLEAAA